MAVLGEAIELGVLRPDLDAELPAFSLTGLAAVMSFRVRLDEKYRFEDAQRFIGALLINGIFPPDQRERRILDEIL